MSDRNNSMLLDIQVEKASIPVKPQEHLDGPERLVIALQTAGKGIDLLKGLKDKASIPASRGHLTPGF